MRAPEPAKTRDFREAAFLAAVAPDEPAPSGPGVDYGEEEEPASAPPPSTVRSWDVPGRLRPGEETRLDIALRWLPVLSVGFGSAALFVPMAGAFGALLRLPLALVAALWLLPWTWLKPRAVGEENPWIAAAPPLLLVLVAALVTARSGPHAGALASTAGLGVASLVLSHLLVLSAGRDVRAREREIHSALEGEARVQRGEELAQLAASAIRLGDHVIVRSGETLVVDGVVASGEALVVPWLAATIEARKRDGDAVLAGLRVLDGELIVTATAVGQERIYGKLFVHGQRTGFIGQVRTWTLRALPGLCVLVGAAEFASNGPWHGVLAAAAAAGVSLSIVGVHAVTSLATVRTQLRGFEDGIAYRSPGALERAGMADVAVLCSRGTVLLGEPEVIAVEGLGSHVDARVLALAAGAEASRGTPAARALLMAVQARGRAPEALRSVLVHEGLGVTALLANGEALVVGSRALLLKERVSVAASENRLRELEGQGASVIMVAVAGKLAGLVALQDALRPGARAAIQRLLEARVEPVLVSGETQNACDTIARALDIEHVRPEVLPQERPSEVRALADGGHVVAVLGRGGLDDAALAAADVAVALGAAGLPGDFGVVLATDDVRAAAQAIALARASRDQQRLALTCVLAPTGVVVLALGFGLFPLAAAPAAAFLGTALGLFAIRSRS